jgi:hypothetical protein
MLVTLGCRVAGLPGCWVAGLLGCSVASISFMSTNEVTGSKRQKKWERWAKMLAHKKAMILKRIRNFAYRGGTPRTSWCLEDGLPDPDRVPISRDRTSMLCLSSSWPKLEWLSSDDIDKGIRRVIAYMELFGVSAANLGNRFWADIDYGRIDKVRVERRIVTVFVNAIEIDTRYFFWYYNTRPTTEGKIGSHWVTCMLDRGNGDALYYFDPFAKKAPPGIKRHIEEMHGLLKKAQALARPDSLPPESPVPELLYYGQEGGEETLQTDSWQCGVWVIWFVHQCLLYIANWGKSGKGMVDHVFHHAPVPGDDPDDQLVFRLSYFNHADCDDDCICVGDGDDSECAIVEEASARPEKRRKK